MSRNDAGAIALDEPTAGALSCVAGGSSRCEFTDASFMVPEGSVCESEVLGTPC
jgi:hypothetical protein